MKDLQSIFQLPYAEFREAYLEQLVYPVFGRESLLEGEGRGVVRRHAELQQLAADTGISDIEHLGDLLLAADATTSLFDVTVADRVLLRRNRAAVQRCIHRLMDRYSCALIIFHYADRPLDPFRLTFCARRGGTEMTDTQRYTYIVGPQQPCRTVAERFATLGQKHGIDITFRDLEAAFAVQPLSDAFFNRYRELYADIVAYATGKRMVKTGNKWEEKTVATPSGPIMQPFRQQFGDEAEKRVRDYIKKLMGRLVFIQFVQRKGWMNGEPDYLQRLYRDYEQEHGSEDTRFVDDRLERVFSCLNTPEGTPERPDLAGIPYLNGGLFGEDGCDRLRFPLPAHFIGEVLSFFGQYNFTIDENDPNEAEVGIDPEMLGRIFESLLEDNKDKGAFYTPKEIVHYMCRESLTAYLLTGITDEPTREAITRFVATHNSEGLGTNTEFVKQVAEHLEAVKICDPAIGSGAFPMGLLRELYALREALADGTADRDPAKLKRHIIEHNIYGVDIDRGAVDIARLRFWLALIVDEEQPQPLPNLDFKIMMGNSLIEEYRGVNLATVTQRKQCEQTNWVENMTDCQRLILGKNIQDYYSEPDHEKKATLHTKIINGVYSVLAENNITPSIIASLRHEGIEDNTRFFLFHTWFYDVFKDNGGFDIVIGNPPYGAKIDNKYKSYIKKRYITANTIPHLQKGSMDSFTLFIELGYKLLVKGGVSCMIVPLALTSSDSLSGVHRILTKQCDDIKISSYAVRPQPVFKHAVINTSILLYRKTEMACTKLLTTKMYRKGHNFNLQHLVDHLEFVDVKDYMIYGRIPKISTPIEVSILNKLNQCKPLTHFLNDNGKPVFYRKTGGRYFKVVTNYSTGSTKEDSINLIDKYANAIGCILSSNLSFWFYQIFSNNLDWRTSEINAFRIPPLSDSAIIKLNSLYEEYLADIEHNANVRTSTGNSRYKVATFKEYKIVKSKAIIDRIDDLICPFYGMTQEETEFIKSYELEFRMSGDD